MWNGYRLPRGDVGRRAEVRHRETKAKMVGRACCSTLRAQRRRLARRRYGITCQDLDETAKKRASPSSRGDFIIVRTGQMERCQKIGSWDGYPGGDAPGFAFETLEWIKRTRLRALASDTWGCEVRPNEARTASTSRGTGITIPIMA